MLPISEAELFALALRYAGGDHNLAEEAAQHVRVQFWRGRYDPTRGKFDSWARIVLRRYCVDARQYRLRARGGDDQPQPERVDRHSDLIHAESRLDLTTPFCDADLLTLRRWSPRQRIVLLNWTELFAKLPEYDRRITLNAENVTLSLPMPGFLTWRETDRTQYLADALRVARNTITQIRCRDMHRVGELHFIRGLRGM